MADGNRCGQGCDSSTIVPAVVYFPSGTYNITAPIISWYYTQMIGDAKDHPVIMAAPNFTGIAMIGESSLESSKCQILTRTSKTPTHILRLGSGISTRTMYVPPLVSGIAIKMRSSSSAQFVILSLTLAKSPPGPMLLRCIGKSPKRPA